MFTMRPPHAFAICHRQCLCVYNRILFPIVIQIWNETVFHLERFRFSLRHKIVAQEHTGDWNLRKGRRFLVQTAEAIVANLVARSSSQRSSHAPQSLQTFSFCKIQYFIK